MSQLIGYIIVADSMGLSSLKCSWYAPKDARVWNRVRNGPTRSSQVVYFGTNRKRICDFLLVINSNLGPILPRFRDIAGFLPRILIFDWLVDQNVCSAYSSMLAKHGPRRRKIRISCWHLRRRAVDEFCTFTGSRRHRTSCNELSTPEMETGHLSWPMTHEPWPLHHFILRMGIGGGVAWWYWTILSVLRAKNRRLKLSLQLWW